jgi:PAS domain S-box-containing protein
VKRKKNNFEEGIKKALSMLERFSPKELFSPGGNGPSSDDLCEQLLQRLNFLLDDRRNNLSKLEFVEKELLVFKNVNVESGKLLERKIEELSLLRLIIDTTTRAMMSQDPFKLILKQVLSIIGADFGFMTFLDPESGQFELRTAISADAQHPEDNLIGIAERIVKQIAPPEHSFRIPDVQANRELSDVTSAEPLIRSLASFPLVVDDKQVGVLTLCSQHVDAFDDETERIMHIIAGQVAVTVQNVLLYAEIKKTKEYLENLVERAGDAIFTLDRSHNIVSWNNGAQTIFERSKDEVIGRTVYDLMPVDAAAALKSQIENLLKLETIVTIETEAARKNGEATQIALTLSPIRDGAGEVIGVSGIAKDISEHKRVEEELRRLNSAKSQFVSTVSHELRTPLTSIKSYVQILLHEMNELPDETVLRYFIIMNDECDRLSGLIGNVLDLQKLESGMLDVRLEPLLLAEVISRFKELFSGITVPNRIELTTEFIVPDHMTRVLGDRKRLMQIFSNLLSNAFKFTQPGGKIEITLTRENNEVLVIISDEGIGIPPDEAEKIFDKFYQVDNEVTRAKGGTGLGLAITKDLVTLHNGRIWVESEEGQGCHFHLAIPAAE